PPSSRPPCSTLFPYTTLFRSWCLASGWPFTVGFELTRPLLLGAGAVALAVVFFTWSRLAPPLPPARARLSLGLRALIVLLLTGRSEEHTSELQSPDHLVCRLL